MWLADPFDEQVVRIDPKTRRVMARIPAGAVTGLAVAGDTVWALSSLGLVRVDAAHDRVAAIAPDADLRRARLVAADDDALWTSGWNSVSRIDPGLVTPLADRPMGPVESVDRRPTADSTPLSVSRWRRAARPTGRGGRRRWRGRR